MSEKVSVPKPVRLWQKKLANRKSEHGKAVVHVVCKTATTLKKVCVHFCVFTEKL